MWKKISFYLSEIHMTEQIFSTEGRSIFLEKDHFIFKSGIFSLIKDGRTTLNYSSMLALCFNYFPKKTSFEGILEHLKYIEQFCYLGHERKCAQKLIKMAKKFESKSIFKENKNFIFSKLKLADLHFFDPNGDTKMEEDDDEDKLMYERMFSRNFKNKCINQILRNMTIPEYELFLSEKVNYIPKDFKVFKKTTYKKPEYYFPEFLRSGNIDIVIYITEKYLCVDDILFLYDPLYFFQNKEFNISLLKLAIHLQDKDAKCLVLVEKCITSMSRSYSFDELKFPEDLVKPMILPNFLSGKYLFNYYLSENYDGVKLITFRKFFCIPDEPINVNVEEYDVYYDITEKLPFIKINGEIKLLKKEEDSNYYDKFIMDKFYSGDYTIIKFFEEYKFNKILIRNDCSVYYEPSWGNLCNYYDSE